MPIWLFPFWFICFGFLLALANGYAFIQYALMGVTMLYFYAAGYYAQRCMEETDVSVRSYSILAVFAPVAIWVTLCLVIFGLISLFATCGGDCFGHCEIRNTRFAPASRSIRAIASPGCKRAGPAVPAAISTAACPGPAT